MGGLLDRRARLRCNDQGCIDASCPERRDSTSRSSAWPGQESLRQQDTCYQLSVDIRRMCESFAYLSVLALKVNP